MRSVFTKGVLTPPGNAPSLWQVTDEVQDAVGAPADPDLGPDGRAPAPPRPRPAAAWWDDPLGWFRSTPLSSKIVGGIGLMLIFVFIRFTVDDAFISWRYGLTFVRTGHWNYSAGPLPRSEGYTNLLYTVAAIIPAALHVPIELFFKLVALATLGGYLHALRRARLPRLQVLALLVIACCNPSFMIMLFSGLETVTFALLLALLFALVYRNGRLDRLGYAVALALTLTRPEGILFAAVAMVWSLVITRRREQLNGLVVVCALWGAYWLWRWHYFRYFWPNTFYVKSGNRGNLSAQLVNVISGLLPALVVAALVLLLAATIWRVDPQALVKLLRNAQNATPVILAVTSAAVVLGLYHSSLLAMNFTNRFEWQLLFPVAVVVLSRPLRVAARAPGPGGTADDTAAVSHQVAVHVARDFWAIIALAVAAVASVSDAPSRFGQLPVAGAAIVLAVAVLLRWTLGSFRATVLAAVAMVVLVSWAPVTEWLGWAAYRDRLGYAHQALGQVINAQPFTGAVAVGDAGLLPFKVHQPVIDIDGLAYTPVSQRTFTEADLDAAHLDLVVALSGSPSAGSQWTTGLGQQVTYGYMLNRGFPSFSGPPFTYGYWLNIWVNPRLDNRALQLAVYRISVRAAQENLRSDGQVFWRGLFQFPFLSNGN
jgi:hypothetical protein